LIELKVATVEDRSFKGVVNGKLVRNEKRESGQTKFLNNAIKKRENKNALTKDEARAFEEVILILDSIAVQ
jgi:hypothetical protein